MTEKKSMEKHASWIVALVVGVAIGAVADHMIAGGGGSSPGMASGGKHKPSELPANYIKEEQLPAGTFAGMTATGRPFDVRCTDVVRIVEGHVAEAWPLLDLAGLLVQVGRMPTARNRELE